MDSSGHGTGRGLRDRVREGLDGIGALGAWRRWRRRGIELRRYATDASYRQMQRERRQHFEAFRSRYAHLFPPIEPRGSSAMRVFVRSRRFPTIEVELALIKALQARGSTTVVGLARADAHLRPYYELAGVREFLPWDPGERTHVFRAQARAALASVRSIDELKKLDIDGVLVGVAALLSTHRRLRTGELNLDQPAHRAALQSRIAASLAAGAWASEIVERARPDLLLTSEIEYTPESELFDTCLARGIPVVRYMEAHRDSTLLFRRHTSANRDDHVASIAPETWSRLTAMDWSERHSAAVLDELRRCYTTGDWFSIPGTQRGTRVTAERDTRAALELDDTRPVGVIFSHIPWDSSFRWGTDLFRSCEEWLIETVRTAIDNDRVQWRIKVHPAHVGKALKERYSGGPADVTALGEALGDLPPHVRLIPPDTPVSTWSLLEVMDYCLTVRGTIGIEAALLGIPVLTAGTGRYDRKGFTIDSSSREEYLDRLAHIETIRPLPEQARTLAQRYAYGLLLCRPLVLSSVRFAVSRSGDIGPDRVGTRVINLLESSFHLDNADAWGRAPDLVAFADWVAGETAEMLVEPTVPAPVQAAAR
ncbi:MAG: hypothetical protein FJW23_05645 [Acidimicrobiia bacterium]|nr:hypothetical protein [Acidimicrobiia bacterium]